MTIKLTREEAIEMLVNATYSEEWQGNEKLTTAHLMAIEALEGVCFDEWCDDCKEYDTKKKCCPRFNKVIRGAIKREPSEDGTLEVKVEDATKIGRVLITDDKHRGGLYYPDEDEPKGEDLISRAEAIEAMGEEPLVWCNEEYEIAERNQWRADIEAIKSVPSADRPKDGDLISRQAATSIPILPKEHRKVFRGEDDAFETGWNEALACVNMLPSADRPRGEWTTDEVAELLANIFGDECACNWNGNDEWLPEVCKYAETTCPSPKEANGCWKQFLIQGGARRK